MSRAIRRHHRLRVLAKARALLHRRFGSLVGSDEIEATARRVADNIKVCSCMFCGCGNPRRLGKRSLDEIRAQLDALEWWM